MFIFYYTEKEAYISANEHTNVLLGRLDRYKKIYHIQ